MGSLLASTCHRFLLVHCRVPAISAALRPETRSTGVGEGNHSSPFVRFCMTWGSRGWLDWDAADIALCPVFDEDPAEWLVRYVLANLSVRDYDCELTGRVKFPGRQCSDWKCT